VTKRKVRKIIKIYSADAFLEFNNDGKLILCLLFAHLLRVGKYQDFCQKK